MNETWKDIPGYEGVYAISNLGRVYSYPRKVKRGFCYGNVGGYCIANSDNGNGYKQAHLAKNGVRKARYIHRLVAEAFCDNPNEYKHVHHIDHDKNNNAASNLNWCTAKENIQHSAHLMRHPKTQCKPTKTGYKYIHKRSGNNKVRYRFVYNPAGIDKSFATLDEAIEYKMGVI